MSSNSAKKKVKLVDLNIYNWRGKGSNQAVIFTWPKIFDFGQALFSSACMCLCVCLCVSLWTDYLRKFLTDFNETWQDDGQW